MSIVTLNTIEEYEKALEISKTNIIVFDFFADWCGPCKRLTPHLQELAEKYTDIYFYKINVDTNEKLTIEYKISSMPTVLFIKDSKVLHRIVGANIEGINKAILSCK